MAVTTIVVLGDVAHRDEMIRCLAPLGRLAWCDRADEILKRAGEGGVGAIVTGFEDESGRSITPMLLAIAARHPRLPVVIHDRVTGGTLHKLLSVLTPGLWMTCVVRPHGDLAWAIERAMGPWFVPAVAPVLLQHFVERAPPSLRLFVAHSALASSSRHGVREVAHWSGVTPRTVERRLQRAHWPAAHVVLQSFAALDVVWQMSQYGWSARHVQEVRGLSHPSAVTRLLARYGGVHPVTLREEGGFATAFEHVARILSTNHSRR